jgi:hypothetical protein
VWIDAEELGVGGGPIGWYPALIACAAIPDDQAER